MATTTPAEFPGVPTLTPKKVATITEWYVTALGDADMSTVPEECSYYMGVADGLEYTLALLHDMATDIVNKTNKGNLKRSIIIVGVVGTTYVLWRNREKIKAAIKKNVLSQSQH
jgi:hypothetical protein